MVYETTLYGAGRGIKNPCSREQNQAVIAHGPFLFSTQRTENQFENQ
jgi:hypothetical protein